MSQSISQVYVHLKRAGFSGVIIGLESGNEKVRSEILNRRYSNDTVRRVASEARRYGIRLGVFNLIGLPGESYADFQDTLRLNQELQPDWHATSIFFPYKGTKLYEMAEARDVLPEKLDFKNERQHAVLNLPDFPPKQVQREFDRFHFNLYKKRKNKSPLKYLLFAVQVIAGHNFMANAKNRLTLILYRLGIKHSLVKIIQKS